MTWDAHVAPLTTCLHAPLEGVQIHLICLPQANEGISAGTKACLTDEEIRRAGRFAHWQDAHRYMAAHAALRMLLAPLCECAPKDVPLEIQPGGKPALPQMRPVHFNLSHSGAFALIAVHPSLEVGIDLELHKPWHCMDDLALNILSLAEMAAWQDGTPSERSLSLFDAWTRKEACLKAVGTGLLVPPDQVELGLPRSPSRGRWQTTADTVVEWIDLDLPLAEAHSACLAWIKP